jgi:hypothetical protein
MAAFEYRQAEIESISNVLVDKTREALIVGLAATSIGGEWWDSACW